MSSTIWQAIGVLLIVAGTLLTLITALGMLRLGSLFARMHAATKPQVLGLSLLCIGLALVTNDVRMSITLGLVVILQLVTAPISAHMLSRAAYRAGRIESEVILVDEYAEDIERAARELENN